MGLEDDIKKAFEESIGGESVQTQKLASDLTNAIVKWVQAQTFVVTELEASQTLTNVTSLPTAPGAPAVIPLLNITTAVSDKGQKPANLKGGGKVESMKSKVQLKRAVEV